MAQNKSYKELMELQGQSGVAAGSGTGAPGSNQMLNLIMNRKPAQYNAATDPAAQAARKTAARNVRTVTRDTLGQHAGMTGGVPSTAAVSAAAQAGNQAMAQGADRVAELEQLYLDNYNRETQGMYNALGALQQQESDAWGRQMQERQWAYQQEQDQKAAADAEYQKKLAMAQLKASYGDYSGLRELGIDTSKMTAGGGGNPGNPGNPSDGDKLPLDVKNDYKYRYGMELPTDVWDQLVGQYGEAAVVEAGFKKKPEQESTQNPAAGTGSTGTGEPGLPGLLHPGVAKGERDDRRTWD